MSKEKFLNKYYEVKYNNPYLFIKNSFYILGTYVSIMSFMQNIICIMEI